MEYIIVGIVAFYIGWKLSSIWSQITFTEILKDLKISDQQLRQLANDKGFELDDEEIDPGDELTLEEIEVRIEQHQGQLYAFRIDTDQFLGQGTSREDLINRLAENLNDVRLVIREENGATLLKQNG
jgi:hypothetical protein